MTDTPAPVFDANGWCHDMSAAPLNTLLLLCAGKWMMSGYAFFNKRYETRTVGLVSRKDGSWSSARHVAFEPTAWRYTPAPPVGE